MKYIITLILELIFSCLSFAAENSITYSFNTAKNILSQYVYIHPNERITLYCRGTFDRNGIIQPPDGFFTDKYIQRAQRLEWEHIVPVSAFGIAFAEWNEGHYLCIDIKGKQYRGRRCAEKTNKNYQIMQSDMYNIYPAIGAVNALRANYEFALLPDAENDFGICPMKIDNHQVEPPVYCRGIIARTYLYMESKYTFYTMKQNTKVLMKEWDKQYPVTQEECTRTKRIEDLQGNENIYVKQQCITQGFW